MAKSTTNDAQALIHSLHIIDFYVCFAVLTALIQVGEATVFHIFFLVIQPVVYMGIVGSFTFNSFLSGVFFCVGTAVHAVYLRIQVNKESKEFKDLPPERAFADCSLKTGAAFGYYEFPWICRLNDRRERDVCFLLC